MNTTLNRLFRNLNKSYTIKKMSNKYVLSYLGFFVKEGTFLEMILFFIRIFFDYHKHNKYVLVIETTNERKTWQLCEKGVFGKKHLSTGGIIAYEKNHFLPFRLLELLKLRVLNLDDDSFREQEKLMNYCKGSMYELSYHLPYLVDVEIDGITFTNKIKVGEYLSELSKTCENGLQ